ncbi:MAG: HD domain-containing phosphohydrolase, partial [Acidimicrobiales bacterium]|nr:HD domain-containing phosphohydrolase [Acidimicrobiales bacterium]
AADGDWRWLETVAQNRLDDPLIKGIVVNTRDITARVQAEELLKATEKRRSDQLMRSVEEMVTVLATLSEGHDPVCAGNQARVAQLVAAIAAELHLDADIARGISIAASIHDVGTIAVAAAVLQRPGPLDEAERALVRQHPQRGHDLVEGIEFPWPVAEMILQHHERLDGSGYPAHLVGSSIGLGARVIAVADVVEAISSPRPYRPALGITAALEFVSQQKGVLFDADVVDACVRVFLERGFAFTSAPLLAHETASA